MHTHQYQSHTCSQSIQPHSYKYSHPQHPTAGGWTVATPHGLQYTTYSACPAMLTSVGITVINIDSTCWTCPTSIARACVASNHILHSDRTYYQQVMSPAQTAASDDTHSTGSIRTGIGGTVVDVNVTVYSSPSHETLTLVPIH